MTDIADTAAERIAQDKGLLTPERIAAIIRKTYSRSRHDGDCYWWTRKICTCGFFHQQIGEAKQSEDIAIHLTVLDRLPQG